MTEPSEQVDSHVGNGFIIINMYILSGMNAHHCCVANWR